KHRVQQTGSFCFSQKLVAKPDQASGWRLKLETDAACTVIDHLRHLSLAPPEGFRNDTDKLVWTINNHGLDRFECLTLDFPGDRFGLRHLKLVTLTSHHLDQNCELQFAASRHFELIGRIRLFNSDR